jgi:hypothetical protein
VAETASRRLEAAATASGDSGRSAADIKNDIAAARLRIAGVLQSAERRISAAAAGATDFKAVPTGWRGLERAGQVLYRRLRARGASAQPRRPRPAVFGLLLIAALVTVVMRTRRRLV